MSHEVSPGNNEFWGHLLEIIKLFRVGHGLMGRWINEVDMGQRESVHVDYLGQRPNVCLCFFVCPGVIMGNYWNEITLMLLNPIRHLRKERNAPVAVLLPITLKVIFLHHEDECWYLVFEHDAASTLTPSGCPLADLNIYFHHQCLCTVVREWFEVEVTLD